MKSNIHRKFNYLALFIVLILISSKTARAGYGFTQYFQRKGLEQGWIVQYGALEGDPIKGICSIREPTNKERDELLAISSEHDGADGFMDRFNEILTTYVNEKCDPEYIPSDNDPTYYIKKPETEKDVINPTPKVEEKTFLEKFQNIASKRNLNFLGLLLNTIGAAILIFPYLSAKRNISDDLIISGDTKTGKYTQVKHKKEQRLNLLALILLLIGFILQLFSI